MQILDINKRISSLAIRFNNNLGEENTKLYFSAAQLDGMPQDFLAGLPRRADDQAYEVDLSYPNTFPILKLCTVPATRRAMELAFDSRCKDVNAPLLDEILTLRHEKSQVMEGVRKCVCLREREREK